MKHQLSSNIHQVFFNTAFQLFCVESFLLKQMERFLWSELLFSWHFYLFSYTRYNVNTLNTHLTLISFLVTLVHWIN
jgi:hypothetical protein